MDKLLHLINICLIINFLNKQRQDTGKQITRIINIWKHIENLIKVLYPKNAKEPCKKTHSAQVL